MTVVPQNARQQNTQILAYLGLDLGGLGPIFMILGLLLGFQGNFVQFWALGGNFGPI